MKHADLDRLLGLRGDAGRQSVTDGDAGTGRDQGRLEEVSP
jgi:hypothetical protein